jgi:hypothetical protein
MSGATIVHVLAPIGVDSKFELGARRFRLVAKLVHEPSDLRSEGHFGFERRCVATQLALDSGARSAAHAGFARQHVGEKSLRHQQIFFEGERGISSGLADPVPVTPCSPGNIFGKTKPPESITHSRNRTESMLVHQHLFRTGRSPLAVRLITSSPVEKCSSQGLEHLLKQSLHVGRQIYGVKTCPSSRGNDSCPTKMPR